MFQRINFDKIIDDYTLKLVVTKDYMKAYLEISLDTDEIPDKNLTVEEIENFLRDKEIVYGVQTNIIRDMIDSRIYQKSVMVAEADMPQKGDDGYIQYTHRIKNSISLNQDDKGNINFKELGWFIQVSQGDILAKKIQPTMGHGGKNLKGEEIPLYGRITAIADVFDALATKAPISLAHNPVTLGTANGLSLSTQQLSLGLASSGVTGALSGTDWNTFNGKFNTPTGLTTNYLPKWNGSGFGNSNWQEIGGRLTNGSDNLDKALLK